LKSFCASESPGESGTLRCVPSPPCLARSFGSGISGDGLAVGSKTATRNGPGLGGVAISAMHPPQTSDKPRIQRMCMRLHLGNEDETPTVRSIARDRQGG